MGVGAAGMVTGLVLLLANENPHRYDRPENELALVPLGWVDARGVNVGVQLRF